MDTELSHYAAKTVQNVLSSFLDYEFVQETNTLTIKGPDTTIKILDNEVAATNTDNEEIYIKDLHANTEIQLWERSWRKTKSPYLYPYSIHEFTFDPSKRVPESTYESLEMIATIFDVEDKKEFEKFPRGMLHVMENAKAVILSEEEGNTLGIAILTQHMQSKKKIAGIWYWGIHKSYRRRGLGKLLLRHVLSTLKKGTDCYLVHSGRPLWEDLMHDLDFSCSLRYGKQ